MFRIDLAAVRRGLMGRRMVRAEPFRTKLRALVESERALAAYGRFKTPKDLSVLSRHLDLVRDAQDWLTTWKNKF